jgi:hypothetical protein
LARRRRLLEAGGDVDGIAGDEGLPGRGIAADDLARVQANAEGDGRAEATAQMLVQPCEAILHLERRPAGAESIVLVRLRNAEDGDDGIADELLHRAAVALERPAHLVEVGEHELPDRLGIDALAHRRRAGHVAEEQRGELTPLGSGGGEGGAAEATVEKPLGALGVAGRANRHASRVRRL